MPLLDPRSCLRTITIDELTAAEKINSSYVSRMLRLTLLAPDIVDAILDGRQPDGMALPALMNPFPVEWERQRRGLSIRPLCETMCCDRPRDGGHRIAPPMVGSSPGG